MIFNSSLDSATRNFTHASQYRHITYSVCQCVTNKLDFSYDNGLHYNYCDTNCDGF